MEENLKKNPNKTRGDTLEVKLRDINLNTYYKGLAHIGEGNLPIY